MKTQGFMRACTTVAVVAVSACTVYLPGAVDAPPPPGTEVRVHLNTPGEVRITDLYGRPIKILDGRLLAPYGDSIFLALLSAPEWGRPWDAVDTLKLQRSEVESLEERRISRGRTALLVGTSSVVLGVVVARLFNSATESVDQGRGGNEDRALIQVLRVVF